MSINLNEITSRQKLIMAKGLLDYQYIMDNWKNNNQDFQEIYYEFYLKSRWAVMKNPDNQKIYFDILQSISPSENLINIINDLYNKLPNKTYEFSIATKLLHTRNPLFPIYDSKIKEYLSKNENVEFWWDRKKGMSGKAAHNKDSKIDIITHDWNNLCQWYREFLKSPRGNQWVEWFDEHFKGNKISDVKKVDFIIFATN